MTFQEVKTKLISYDKSKGVLVSTSLGIMQEWERDFLFSISAVKNINDEMVIASEYPMLSITKSNGEEIVKDFDGSIYEINAQIAKLNEKTSTKNKIKYYPRNYSAYLKAKKEIEEAEEKSQFVADKMEKAQMN